MKIIKEYKHYVQCDCRSEYIVLEPQDTDCLECGLFMSVLSRQFEKQSFWHRFRHIWHTLIYGTPYVDQVCLDLGTVKELEKYLKNYLALIESETKHKK